LTDEIAAAGDAARAILEAKHLAREITMRSSRDAIRSCATAIRAVHREEFERARELIAEAAAKIAEVEAALDGHDDVRHTGFFDAEKEFAEASLTLAFVAGEPLPTADDLGIGSASHLNGMAEAASELRRRGLDCLRRGDIDDAERMLATMDDVYSMLVTIDYPDGLTHGLRRTTDALRAVLERTRGDVTNAIVATRLQRAIEQGSGEGPLVA
jgi:translin